MAKMVAITWPHVTYRVPLVKCLLTEVIPHGQEHACVWIYIYLFFIIDYRNLLKRCPQNCIWVTSGMRLSHLGNAFESPRNHVWVTSDAELIANTWQLGTYRVFPVNCFITDFIPRGPEHACVWIYIPVFYCKLSKLTEEMPSELHLSHLGKAFESPRNCFWITSELPLSHLARNCFRINSELRFSHLGITFESPRNHVWVTSELRLNDLGRKIGRNHLTTCHKSCVTSLLFDNWNHSSRSWACVRLNIFLIFIKVYRNWLERNLRNCIWVTSELLFSHLGIDFESPSSELRLR